MTEFPAASHRNKSRSLVVGSGLLGAALLVTSLFSCVLTAGAQGSVGIVAVGCAFLICWISGTLALWITLFTSESQNAVSGMFLSIAVRTGLPLALGVIATIIGGPLAEAGIFGYILAHYLVGLLAETLIAVRLISKDAPEVSISSKVTT